MALEILRKAPPVAMVADRRLYLDGAQKRLVEDGDPSAAYLLAAGPGDMLSPDIVARLDLELVDNRVTQRGAAAPAEDAPPPDNAPPAADTPPAGDDVPPPPAADTPPPPPPPAEESRRGGRQRSR